MWQRRQASAGPDPQACGSHSFHHAPGTRPLSRPQYFADRNIFCAGRVETGDMERVTKATGAKVQTTVNNLDTKVLGTCERFEERQVRACVRASWLTCLRKCLLARKGKVVMRGSVATMAARAQSKGIGQRSCTVRGSPPGPTALTLYGTTPHHAQVGAERYNLFTGCPAARTATLVLRGGSEQFIDEADRSLHDAIMIVRRALKHAQVRDWGLTRNAVECC